MFVVRKLWGEGGLFSDEKRGFVDDGRQHHVF